MHESVKNIPVCIIGAGGIVHDAHLPAYAMAGFRVQGIMDKADGRARHIAEQFNIPDVYEGVAEMVSANGANAVYDVALPASEIINVLQQLPDGAAVLIQKPLGESLQEAMAITELCHRKQLIAGVNLQLRFAPAVREARRMISEGMLGELTDVEIYINVHTPWHLWEFLFSKERMEINYHSIHYIDLVRALLGNPERVFARSFKHPAAAGLTSVRSTIIMDYGEMTRAVIHTNHNHDFGPHNQEAYVKIEGTKGAIKMGIGVLMNYPHGVPDTFEYVTVVNDVVQPWQSAQPEGSWFPHAFRDTMEQVLLAKAGLIQKPENSVDDALDTMRCVEAAYISNETGGINLPGS